MDQTAEAIIRPFATTDRTQVIDLWKTCNLTVPWNDPDRDIDLKLDVDPDLFLVVEKDKRVVGTAMGGYEGHRGWIYYLAVHPDNQGQGFGKLLVTAVEEKLAARGCPKLNLMVRTTNAEVIEFYSSLGYQQSDVVCLGKKLPDK